MRSSIDFANEIWETPMLPPIPEKVSGVLLSSCLLSEEDDWEFLFEEIEDIPSPFCGQQDYNFDGIKQKEWGSVIVPSSLIMQGYDIKNNTEYYYRKKIRIPSDYSNKRVFLRFEGVYSNCRIWVNNQYLKTHVGGFTCWDCDISNFADEREITLIVGVADLEGPETGIWNPEGNMVSDSAWASHYAHNNIGGILRDVILYALPDNYIVRTHIETVLDENYENAQLQMDVQIHGGEGHLQLKTELMQEDGTLVKGYKENVDHCSSMRIILNVEQPKLWDAEHPNLYLLHLSLYRGEEMLQENLHQVGFRQICYGGMRGTECNKVYINGKEIKLHGVCRHDISHTLGRCIKKEDAYLEILAYKKNNVNHIRTSHYPASKYLLSACDQLGIYVEQENSACFKGANGYGVNCGADEFVNSFAEMIESSRNHPSVIIWSLGNESGFETTTAFRTEYQYGKKCDPTRPIIFSYPDTVESSPLPYDIFSFHYANVDGELGGDNMPMLHDEFAHVACYNHKDLIKENSVREFWGESIKRGWDNIFQTEGALGCAIWGGIDEVFYLPEGVKESHQHHAPGKAAGYGEWGAILDVYKREKPEAYLTKKAFSPILIIEEKCRFDEDTLLYLCNRFDHTCLTEIRMTCMDTTGILLYDEYLPAEIGPHEEGSVLLAGIDTKKSPVRIQFYHGDFLVEELLTRGEQENMVQNRSVSNPTRLQDFHRKEENGIVYLIGTAASLKVNQTTGTVEFLDTRGIVYADNGNIRINGELQSRGQQVQVTDRRLPNGRAEVIVREIEQNQMIRETVYTFNGVSCHVAENLAILEAEGSEVDSLSLELPIMQETAAVKFHRKGLYSLYPEDHIGRNVGTAYKKRIDCEKEPDRYGVKPKWSYGQDMSNYFLYQDAVSVTNDFRTKRTNLLDYSVVFLDGMELHIEPETSSLAAIVMENACENKSQEILQLSIGSYYKSLEWGNYCGEIPMAKQKPQIAFIWSFKKGEAV